jgi:hypothetical protein
VLGRSRRPEDDLHSCISKRARPWVAGPVAGIAEVVLKLLTSSVRYLYLSDTSTCGLTRSQAFISVISFDLDALRCAHVPCIMADPTKLSTAAGVRTFPLSARAPLTSHLAIRLRPSGAVPACAIAARTVSKAPGGLGVVCWINRVAGVRQIMQTVGAQSCSSGL